jgi:hypothetical protein
MMIFIVVVNEVHVFMCFRTAISQMSGVTIDLARHESIHGLNELLVCSSSPLCVDPASKQPDEILTYRYVKPWVHWFPTEEDPLTDPFRIARGLCPSGMLVRTLWQRDSAEPNSTAAFA